MQGIVSFCEWDPHCNVMDYIMWRKNITYFS